MAGGLLIVIAGVAMLAAAASGVMRAPRGEEAAAAVLALGAGVVLVHALVDVDWDFVGFGVPVLGVLGALAARGVIEDRSPALRAARRRRRPGRGRARVPARAAVARRPATWTPAAAPRTRGARCELAERPATATATPVAALLAEADARERARRSRGDRGGAAVAMRIEPWNYEPYLRRGCTATAGATRRRRRPADQGLRPLRRPAVDSSRYINDNVRGWPWG